MAKTLTVKTDASYKEGVGFTVAYETEIFDSGYVQNRFSDSKFIDKSSKSTEAEVVGVAYGIIETYKNMGGRVEKCNLILESDCQHAVNIFRGNKSPEKYKMHRTVMMLLEDFYSWNINWIPRTSNEKANALAKHELRKAESR